MTDRAKTFDALPESVRDARRFADEVLDDVRFAGTGTAVLIVSELVTNAIAHSLSARPGGQVTVTVTVAAGQHVRIAVADAGPADGMAPAAPASCPPEDGEGGRGLYLVTQLAERWGYEHGQFWVRLPWHAADRATEPVSDPGALFAMSAGGAW